MCDSLSIKDSFRSLALKDLLNFLEKNANQYKNIFAKFEVNQVIPVIKNNFHTLYIV